ncbi:MAG: glucose-1-phosphate adenylyltransferase [Candidatus Aminicenantia bacterium]
MENVVAVIMAGGGGERLYPLTKHETKPAVPFGGIYRIIDFTLSNCINSGIRKIFVLTQYKSQSLIRHLRDGWSILSPFLGEFIEILHPQKRISEHWYLGTADSVYQNSSLIKNEKPRFTLILAGDHIYKIDYKDMLKFHTEKGADLTIGVIEMDITDATRFGVIEINHDGKVIGFEEKPAFPKCIPGNPHKTFVSMGIYVFNTEILFKELEIDNQRKESTHDFGRDIIPNMIGKYKVYSFNFYDYQKGEPLYWKDIGTIDAYYESHMDLISVVPKFNLYDSEWPVRTFVPVLPPAKFVHAEEGRIGHSINSLVSHGSIISGGFVINSILSPNVKVHSYSVVEDSVIHHDVEIGRFSKIKRAIVMAGTKIPPYTFIGYNHEEDIKRFIVSPQKVVVVQPEDFG